MEKLPQRKKDMTKERIRVIVSGCLIIGVLIGIAVAVSYNVTLTKAILFGVISAIVSIPWLLIVMSGAA